MKNANGNSSPKKQEYQGEHTTVLLEETINALNIVSDGIYIDCTLGGGGHSEKICERLDGTGILIGIDQDPYALYRAEARLASYTCQKRFVHHSFFNLKQIVEEYAPNGVNGICFDLGVSSFQFDDPERGFSYHNDGPLDMRMDTTQKLNAADVVNTYSREQLIRILKTYGEEKYASGIADTIIRERAVAPIVTTLQLAELIRLAYPPNARYKDKHPARKSFQAIRIEVNRELDHLEEALKAAIDGLKPGGRLAVISFHSLEDRLVKQFFKKNIHPCVCPPDFPICVCGKKPVIKPVTGKPILPGKSELEMNRRSRSAKLRVVEKITEEKA